MLDTVSVTIDDASSRKWGVDYSLPKDEARPRAAIRPAREPQPPWVGPVFTRLNELMQLTEVEAQGYRTMDLHDIVASLKFLDRLMGPETRAPWIGRLGTGGIQFTWRVDDVEVEAVFDRARGEEEVFVAVGGSEWTVPVREADSLFMNVRPRLAAS